MFIFSGVELSTQQVEALQRGHIYAAYLHSETMRVVVPYLVLAGLALTMLILVAATKFPTSMTDTGEHDSGRSSIHALWKSPQFLLAVAAQFACVGAQVGSWSYFIPYIQSYTREPERVAGYILTASLVAFGIGRFVSAWLMRTIQPSKLMGIYCVINTGLAVVGIAFPGWIGVGALMLTSFFMSLLFPTIFAQGIRGLGVNTKLASSLLVMAIVGGAVLTPIMGLISVYFSLAIAYTVPLLAYIFIAFFAFADARMLMLPRDPKSRVF